ncbi:Protein of unknown function [Pyronema omphalodes CBS 100304]|uniref:Uncharacterized protein n=1 Tax=Pyronema omphalodes (strain CBS 100304) TaxID=1076935 RepID=U4L916_PYROM|nr:Protein of unknown function [Pyronema omphalodes CBS 100304]
MVLCNHGGLSRTTVQVQKTYRQPFYNTATIRNSTERNIHGGYMTYQVLLSRPECIESRLKCSTGGTSMTSERPGKCRYEFMIFTDQLRPCQGRHFVNICLAGLISSLRKIPRNQ